MRVEQFHAKNQFILKDDAGNTFFQSYQSIIAKQDRNGNITLDKHFWDYSNTTGKYRNLFLGDKSRAETLKKINSGEYKLDSLN